ncbi:MAG TPA: hypothetical protein VHD32_15755 [Candidatus Didemnitutus sp.]|jgi:hypothetical protein|nr:hypothetical protein [Candidatus Didemnitutus sp.]
MKLTTVFLALVGLLAVGTTLSVAYSRSKTGEVLSSREQFAQLRPGDRILYLCRQCDARREVTLASKAEAVERFKEGAEIICPGCKDRMRVVIGKGAQSSPQSSVRFVNEKGGECMYVTMVPRQK